MTIYFFIYTLVFVSTEKIYQTVKKVIHPLSKHLEFWEKYFPGHHVSTMYSLQCLYTRWNTISHVWYNYYMHICELRESINNSGLPLSCTCTLWFVTFLSFITKWCCLTCTLLAYDWLQNLKLAYWIWLLHVQVICLVIVFIQLGGKYTLYLQVHVVRIRLYHCATQANAECVLKKSKIILTLTANAEIA